MKSVCDELIVDLELKIKQSSDIYKNGVADNAVWRYTTLKMRRENKYFRDICITAHIFWENEYDEL